MDNREHDTFPSSYVSLLKHIKSPEHEEQYRALTSSEERELIDRYSDDREKLEYELICHNLTLVIPIIKKYRDQVDIDDLFQSGVCGIMDAVKRFDTETGHKFSTYAYHYIRKYVFTCYKQHNRDLDGSTNQLVTSFDCPNTIREGDDISESLQMSVIDVNGTIDIDPSNIAITCDSVNYNSNLVSEMIESGIMNSNESRVIESIYFSEIPRRQIAHEMGISVTMVGSHHKNAMKKMKKFLVARKNIRSTKDVLL